MKTRLKVLAAALAMASVTAQAQLELTGPGSVATGGFPKFYQDTTGLALDICLPKPGLERAPIRCIMADLPNPNAEISFPNNFPDEAFWWTGETTLALQDGKEALLVLALEAAFANELPAEGDQVAFSRIRLRINEPRAGHYVVTHPYGTEEFDVEEGQTRVFMTDDFGDFSFGDFSRAGKGRLGPFLLPANGQPGGDPLPPVSVTLEDGTVRQYIADAGEENFVVGSPLGTNFFKIDIYSDATKSQLLETSTQEMFVLGGRIYNGTLDSDTSIERATYSQDESGYTIDFHVKARQALGQAAPNFKVFAQGIPGATMSKSPNNNSDYYGQIKITKDKPNNVFVSDLREDPDRLFSAKLVDAVTVKKAVYNASTQTLHIEAESSDKSSQHTGSLPKLTATGSDRSQPYDGTFSDGSFDISGLPQAPEKVYVNSSEGGRGELAVVTTGVAITPENLVAENDDGVPGAIDVLANDVTTGAVEVNIVQEPYPNTGNEVVFLPEFGTVTVSGTTVTYTQTKAGTGHDTFSYYLTDAAGNVSNIAQVTVNLAPVNLPPVANPNFTSVSSGSPVIIDVLENDSDPEGSALTLVSVSSANAAIVDSKIVYTAPAGSGGSQQSFTYTVSDAEGAQATANVNVTVTQPVTVNIALAEYRTSKQQWRVSGSVNPAFVGMTVKVYRDVNGNNRVDAGIDQLLGETLGLDAADAAAGAWDFRMTGGVVGVNGWRILAVSSLGGVAGSTNLAVRR